MPISATELKALRDELKRVDQELAGLQARLELEAGRVVPAGEPPARSFRLR